MPGYWLTRNWSEVSTNTAFALVAHQVYDATLGYPFYLNSISTRAAL